MSSRLQLVRAGKPVTAERGRSPQMDALRRRGLIFDAVLRGLLQHAHANDPELTIEDAAHLLTDFPDFLSSLRLNLRGSGLVREMPNVQG